MKVYCNKKILENNRDVILEHNKRKDIEVSFMIKKELLKRDYLILKVLEKCKVYSTGSQYADAENIYESNNVVIVDAFERREGITLEEAKKVKNKKIAIVNFYCCENTRPMEIDLLEITLQLKKMGYKKVSLGGSMLMNYQYAGYDEIRVGEAFLTGYSTVSNMYFDGLENPFKIEVDIFKEDGDRTIIKEGFLTIGGFTDVDTICVNTDFTVLKFARDNYVGNGKIVLKPDYFTLIKLADKGYLDNVKYI